MRALTLVVLGLAALSGCGQERAPAADRQASAAPAPAKAAPAQGGRTVAVTFDDLPGVGAGGSRGSRRSPRGWWGRSVRPGCPPSGS